MSKVCLVTGVPGIGKTSLCNLLAQTFPDTYIHISFGQLILEILHRENPRIKEQKLRSDVTNLVTPEVLAKATKVLNKRIAQTKTSQTRHWVVIDSHAVSQDWYGYVATPDGSDYFKKLKYNAIINLFAKPLTVLSRSDQKGSGRQALTIEDVSIHASIQNAVSVLYSSVCHCPLYFVSSEQDISTIACTVNNILSNLSKP